MALILHITSRSHWEKAQRTGVYQADSLTSEGFIHCSTASQLVGTAKTFFQAQSGLVLLGIDTDRLQAPLRYEGAAGGEQFPHVYGPLNLDAVTQVWAFEPDANGNFSLPAAIEG